MKRDVAEAIDRMFGQVASEFGTASAERMVRIMAENLGSLRLVFPDIEDITRMVRNQHIFNSYRGNNVVELALRNNLTAKQIRNIVQGMQKTKKERRFCTCDVQKKCK